jgi:hypothetical protein
MERRFTDNSDLLKAIACVNELKREKLQPLTSLGISLPSEEELVVAKEFLKKQENPNPLAEIYQHRVAFKDTYELLATVATFGCSTVVCESAFSVLTRINRPNRLSMSQTRQSNLIFLAFAADYTDKISYNKFLRRFHEAKNRKLQLF